MKGGDLVTLNKPRRPYLKGYGIIVELHGGDMAKVIWQGIACNSSWEMLHDLVDAADELMVFNS